MWAGGRLEFRSIGHGARLHRRSTIKAIEQKNGGSGEMVFVTVEHEVCADGALAVIEQQDIVYLGEQNGAQRERRSVATAIGAVERVLIPDETMLFRFSALTFNGHRIHYDLRYTTETECYRTWWSRGR